MTATLTDIQSLGHTAIYAGGTVPHDHVVATTHRAGIFTTYLLPKTYHRLDAPVLGRIEIHSGHTVGYLGSSLDGGERIDLDRGEMHQESYIIALMREMI